MPQPPTLPPATRPATATPFARRRTGRTPQGLTYLIGGRQARAVGAGVADPHSLALADRLRLTGPPVGRRVFLPRPRLPCRGVALPGSALRVPAWLAWPTVGRAVPAGAALGCAPRLCSALRSAPPRLGSARRTRLEDPA